MPQKTSFRALLRLKVLCDGILMAAARFCSCWLGLTRVGALHCGSPLSNAVLEVSIYVGLKTGENSAHSKCGFEGVYAGSTKWDSTRRAPVTSLHLKPALRRVRIETRFTILSFSNCFFFFQWNEAPGVFTKPLIKDIAL